MNILLVNTTKMVGDTGGLAKVTCAFANEMKKRGHQVSLIYADEKSGEFFFPIDKDIACYDVRFQDGKRIKYPVLLRLKRELYRIFSKQKARTVNNDFFAEYVCPYMGTLIHKINPDIIVSFAPGTSKLLILDLGIQKDIPIITMSHGNPADYFEFYPLLSLEAVKRTDVNQVLLPSFKRILEDNIPGGKVVVIGNVVQQFDRAINLARKKDSYKIIFIGRLAKGHKRPHLLIEAFSKIADSFPNWCVEFWGADENKAYKQQLELMVKRAHLTDRISFKGITKNVGAVLDSADIYAMVSATEGFGLSMAEAMSKGLPVLACNSWLGVSDLVQNNKNGILVDDNAESIARGLALLMENEELRVSLGRQAHEDMKRYSPDIIWSQWENLLDVTVSDRSRNK